MNLDAIPYAIPLLMVGGASMAIAVAVYPRRNVSGALPFILLTLAHAAWAVGLALQFLLAGNIGQSEQSLIPGFLPDALYPGHLLWVGLEVLGALFMPVMALAFAAEYTILKFKIPSRIWLVLLAEPVAAFLLLLTDFWHNLIGFHFVADASSAFFIPRANFGGWFYAHLLFAYTMLFLAVLLLLRALFNTPRNYAWQVGVLLIGLAIPWVGSYMDVTGVRWFGPLPLAPVLFIATQFAFVWSVLRYRMLEIQPVARDNIIESLKDGIIMLDNHNRVIDLNPTACKIFNISRAALAASTQTLTGIPLNRLLPPEYSDLIESINDVEERVLEIVIDHNHKDLLLSENESSDPDAAARPFEMRISPLYNWRKVLTGRLITLHDIADQKELQAALYASEEKYRSVIERSNDGILIIQDGHICFANRQVAAMLGYTMDELRATSLFDHLSPETGAEVRDRLERRQRGEVVAPRFETELWHRNGRTIEVEMSAGVMEYEQRPAMLVFVHDITGVKRAAQELDHSLSLLQSTIQSTADGILVVDNEGGVITYNERYIEMWRLPEDWVFSFDADDRLEYLASQTIDPKSFRKRSIEMAALTEKVGHDQFTLSDGRIIECYVTPYRVSQREESDDNGLTVRVGREASRFIAGKVWNYRDVTERRQVEEALRAANEQLKINVQELERHNQEVTLLGEMGDLLHSCAVPDEAYRVAIDFAARLFPGYSGRLYILDSARNQVEVVARWGTTSLPEVPFTPDRCWALRRGRPHAVRDPENDLNCMHALAEQPAVGNRPYLCVPMIAQSETIGILFLRSESDNRPAQLPELLAVTVADSIAMSLANLRLREKLRAQSIRDPLTGLFNRRYMEEALELELSRARRYHRQVGVIMIDLDHFKNFNDTYGHRAGDLLLKEFGEFLIENCRDEDIACRYGGEEFILILPEAGVDNCAERAEELRQKVKDVTLEMLGQKVGFTISLGVAGFPQNGTNLEAVVGAADSALYEAKRTGRNRVVVVKT